MARKWNKVGLIREVIAGDLEVRGKDRADVLGDEDFRALYLKLLVKLAPNASKDALELACRDLLKAREMYRHKFPIVAGRIFNENVGRMEDLTRARPTRHGISLSESRKDLKSLIRKTEKQMIRPEEPPAEMASAVAKLSLGAMMAFCRFYGPIGKLKRMLESSAIPTEELEVVHVAAANGLQVLKNEPDHSVDQGIVCLACDVYEVLQVTLGVKAAMTRDDERICDEGDGANYARLLRLCIASAGGTPPRDLLDLMKKGKRLSESFG